MLMDTCDAKGHIVPEARLGGPIALVQDGDRIVIDSEKRTIDWVVGEEEEARPQARAHGAAARRGLEQAERDATLTRVL